MKRPMIQKRFLQVLAWTAVVALSAVVALAQQSATGARSDGQIEMDVVHALDASQQLKNDLITAATIQSEVTLSGTVASEQSKKLAESIVAGVNGVAKIHNNLKIGDPQAASEAENLQTPAAEDPSASQSQSAQQSEGPSQQQQGYAQQAPAQQQYPAQSQYPDQGQAGQYPQQQQGQYPQGRYGVQSGYGQQPQAQPFNYRQAPGPLTIQPGALIALRTSEPVASKHAQDGQPIQFVVIADVDAGGYVAIPRGATVHGVITEVKNTERGDLGGSSALSLRLISVDLGGQTYPLETDEFRVKGPNKAGRTVGNAIGGALLGAIIGGAAGGGTGAAIGAGAGAGAGTIASAASQGPGVWIPAEARVDFHLQSPVTVTPVDAQEAARLAQGLYPGGPTLYRRPPAYYGQPVIYAYPPPYYHPYYMVGGYYGWR